MQQDDSVALSVALLGPEHCNACCFHGRTSAFLRAALGVRNHWILEASNIRPPTKKALHLCKALIFLAFLAPRPGLEPGTYGLTGYRSIGQLTRMNARCSGFSRPIFLVRFTSARPRKGRSESLDIGRGGGGWFQVVRGSQPLHLAAFSGVTQDALTRCELVPCARSKR